MQGPIIITNFFLLKSTPSKFLIHGYLKCELLVELGIEFWSTQRNFRTEQNLLLVYVGSGTALFHVRLHLQKLHPPLNPLPLQQQAPEREQRVLSGSTTTSPSTPSQKTLKLPVVLVQAVDRSVLPQPQEEALVAVLERILQTDAVRVTHRPVAAVAPGGLLRHYQPATASNFSESDFGWSSSAHLQHPGHGTGPSSTMWGRGPMAMGVSIRITSPGCRSRLATRHFPKPSTCFTLDSRERERGENLLSNEWKISKVAQRLTAATLDFYARVQDEDLPRKPCTRVCAPSSLAPGGPCSSSTPPCRPSTSNPRVFRTWRTGHRRPSSNASRSGKRGNVSVALCEEKFACPNSIDRIRWGMCGCGCDAYVLRLSAHDLAGDQISDV